MQLTQFTDFSLRALMYLTYRDRDNLVTIDEIAEQFDISRNHLIKIVNNLVKKGWVNAVRGRNGGIELAMSPEQIPLGALVRQLENHDSLIDCAKTRCVIIGNCHLKSVLDKAMTLFYRELDQYTLKDMITGKTGKAIIKMHRNLERAS